MRCLEIYREKYTQTASCKDFCRNTNRNIWNNFSHYRVSIIKNSKERLNGHLLRPLRV